MGDLNYRCEFGVSDRKAGTRLDRNPPKARVRDAVAALGGEFDKQARLRYFETDQLTDARKRGDAFLGFEEGNPARAHMPTFKVQRERGFKYKEQRTPAWCDRVLWRTAEGFISEQTMLAAAGDIGTSDHKPVAAALELELLAHSAIVHFEDDVEGPDSPRRSRSKAVDASSVDVAVDALENRRRGRGPRTRRRKRRVRVARALGLARVHEDGVFVAERQGAQVAPPETLSASEVLSVVFRAGSIRPDAILRVAVTILDAPREPTHGVRFRAIFGPVRGVLRASARASARRQTRSTVAVAHGDDHV